MHVRRYAGWIACCVALALAGAAAGQDQLAGRNPEANQPEPASIDGALLDRCIELAGAYLMSNQEPDGRFAYEFDFVEGRFTDARNEVRQTGALWGMALLHRHAPSPVRAAAVERGLALFRRHERRTTDKLQFPVYPGTGDAKTNMLALVMLALCDYIPADGLTANQRYDAQQQLERYVEFLLTLRREDGQFFSSYDPASGYPVGRPNPYSDGEALLALLRSARLLKRDDLREILYDSAAGMYQQHCLRARIMHPDSNQTKGFYQWGSMAFFEMHDMGWDEDDRFARRTVDLAHWMIDVHHTLRRTRNTAYAHEGLAVAHELARRLGDDESVRKIRRVLDQGLGKLVTWQVGGPHPCAFLIEHPTQDPRAIGGVMNAKDDPVLRIDVAQHQLHAMLLARRFVYRNP